MNKRIIIMFVVFILLLCISTTQVHATDSIFSQADSFIKEGEEQGNPLNETRIKRSIKYNI